MCKSQELVCVQVVSVCETLVDKIPSDTNIHIEMDMIVLVVFKEIGRYRKALQTLRVLITRQRKSFFSHFGCLEGTAMIVEVEQTDMLEKLLLSSVYFSMSSIANLFTSS